MGSSILQVEVGIILQLKDLELPEVHQVLLKIVSLLNKILLDSTIKMYIQLELILKVMIDKVKVFIKYNSISK